MLAVGRILKAHGIRGDVKAESFMDSPDCLMRINDFIIDGQHYKPEKITPFGNFLLIRFNGINDMTAAEEMRGKTLYCEECALPEPEDGRYYIAEVTGCTVSDGKNDYGKIREVLQYGSADVIVAEKKGKRVMFPWTTSLNARVDVDAKLFIVDGEKLAEVLLNED
ncbi:MAG: ribosome maturation factor RimM [Christensenellales bacterium]